MTSSKQCFKCSTVKPLTEFYKHKAMADGHLNKCKDCAKKDSLGHRNKNIERIREYDRKRGKLAHRIALRTIVNRNWRAEDRRRQRAHDAVRYAIMTGRMVKQSCERCESTKTVAHHEDYDKPLSVMWLCQPCHKQRHKELKEAF
jgi:hypothetical protein